MIHTAIPFVDLRGKTPIDLLRAYPDRARDLIRASRRSWGLWSQIPSYPALAVGDRLSRRWLIRQNNPYRYEIETIAELLKGQGGYALNLCFEWGCTSGVWNSGETASLMRVLDWPFPGLGKYMVVALQSGAAGNFYNVTWPGMVGVFSGMAPGRFSAAINQAPMRRHNLGFAGDWMKNRTLLRGQKNIPPAHLLRHVFETAKNYEEAKTMLATTPIAMPVMFVLAGTKKDEGCIIERLEDSAQVIPLAAKKQVVSANHFMSNLHHEGKGWRPREIDSAGRYQQACLLPAQELDAPHFGWLKAPALNANTRLALVADAAEPRLMVQGFEGTMPVTAIFQMGMSREQTVEVATETEQAAPKPRPPAPDDRHASMFEVV
jgi:hypothetical protein